MSGVSDNSSNQAEIFIPGPRDPALKWGHSRRREARSGSLEGRPLSRASLIYSVTSQMTAKDLTRLAASLIMHLYRVKKNKVLLHDDEGKRV